MPHLLEMIWHGFQYRFAMANAYLASHMGEQDVADNYLSWAGEAQRKLDTLRIQ